MATEPQIIVTQRASEQININPNYAGDIAIIGAFDSEITNLTVCTNVTEAKTKFGIMETEGDFKGTDAIPLLFTGASSLLVANITTYTTGDNPEAETTLTETKLRDALNKLHHVDFDILFIAEELSDSQQEIVTAWLDAEFEAKYPHGQVAELTKSTASAYETSVSKFHDKIFYINTQIFGFNGETLSLNRSTALITGFIAGTQTNLSLTNKEITGVTSVSPEYSTAAGELGAALLSLNIPFLKRRFISSKKQNVFYCVNSQLPDGFDIYIYRVRDQILKDIQAEVIIGQQNDEVTENGVVTLMEGLKQRYVQDYGRVNDIKYHIEDDSDNSQCINIVIDEIVFNDIITLVNIYYSIRIE